MREKLLSIKENGNWVRPIFIIERRLAQGANNNLVNKLQQDHEKFVNYFRMEPALFKKLLQLVGLSITKLRFEKLFYLKRDYT